MASDILLIDDDEFQLGLLTAILQQLGDHTITRADSGAAALAQIRDGQRLFDLIFCDLQMPEMDGIEVLRHLADAHCTSALVLISGAEAAILTTAVELARERGLRVVGGLSKPVSREQITRILQHQLPDQRPAATTTIAPGELEQALAEEQLLLHYQPKVATADRRIVGAECLVRWEHPDHGLVPPDAFIAVAERHGLIDALTSRVLELALAQAGAWRAQGLTLPLSVNLSMDNLHDIRLPDQIKKKVQDAAIPPEAIVLEITESRLAEDLITAKEILTRLRLAGFALSIDDFGTGFSSLKQLGEIPFTELKIDRAFVAGAHRDPARHAILEASARMGRQLGLKVVAEGVENQADWDTVAAAGCNYVQGWVISRPLSAKHFEDWVQEWPDGSG